jgi:hypothetical protein
MGHDVAAEGLQSGAVHAAAELAVAQGQSPIDLVPLDRVTNA